MEETHPAQAHYRVTADYAMGQRDAEVVVAAGCLFHCVGMSIHRDDHERYSLFLTADKLASLLADAYEEPERTIIAAETLHDRVDLVDVGFLGR